MGGLVREEQMRNLFGLGSHPDDEAIHLGRRFMQFEQVDDPYPGALSGAFAAFRAEQDRAPEVGVERDLIRWNVARELLVKGGWLGEPADADIAHYLATRGAEQRQPVAGYDLVFTPVKSVSVLWGLADARVREQVAQAHRAAWTEALGWVGSEAALTRIGAGGVGQINTLGLVAAAFDHLDSRTGDPNLHTHVAVSTKVQGVDGKWRSLDGRVLHALGVAASERYNTAVETQLRRRLGVEFVEEPRAAGKLGVREVAGIEEGVRKAFSRRRASIEGAYEALVAGYRAKHGHEPARAVQFRLAQQATLDTRGHKGSPVPLSARLSQWSATAAGVLGSARAVRRMITGALTRHPDTEIGESETVEELGEQVLRNLGERRAVWNVFHVQAEAQRVVRASAAVLGGAGPGELVEAVAGQVRGASIALTSAELNAAPAVMRRVDGASIYTVHGGCKYTSAAVIDAEDALVAAADRSGGLVVAGEVFERAVAQVNESTGRRLNAGQVNLARRFAAGGHLIEAGVGPAGTGKTTAMVAFTRAVTLAGGRVVGLAPSAAAAAVLGDELGIEVETLHKLLDAHARGIVRTGLRLDASTVLLVDEAGMAGTPELGRLVDLAGAHGASVRLLGDPAQLSAVGAGGALRLIDEMVGAAHLEQVHRFTTRGEAEASLRLRGGDAGALDFYVEAARTRGGTREAMLEDVYAAWWADTAAGRASIMVASTNDDVAALNARARLDRVNAGVVESGGGGGAGREPRRGR